MRKRAHIRWVNSFEANFSSLSLPPPLFSHPIFTTQHHTTSAFSFLNFAVILSAVASLCPPPHPPRLFLNTNDQQQEAGKGREAEEEQARPCGGLDYVTRCSLLRSLHVQRRRGFDELRTAV